MFFYLFIRTARLEAAIQQSPRNSFPGVRDGWVHVEVTGGIPPYSITLLDIVSFILYFGELYFLLS